MAWETVNRRINITYLSIGNNLTLYMKQVDGEQHIRAEVLFVHAIGNHCDVIDVATVTSAEELAAFMAQWLKTEREPNVSHV